MSDDTSAALIASLDVKFDQLAKNMRSAIQVFNDGGRKLEKRQAQIKKNLSNWAIDFSGLGGLNKALVGLTGAAVVGGIGELVKKSLDAASAIGDTAQQAGVSVEFLQKLRFAASQSGASFDIMDTALTTLNKSLGDFVNTGAGKGAAAFKQLGIDKLINGGQVRDAEQAFDAIVKKVNTFGSEAQKSALLAGVFGKEAGPKLLQLVNEGADGIARLEAQAVSLGIVLSEQTVRGAKEASDKLDALFSVIKAQGVSAIANLAPQIANLAQEITDGLPDLILWVERWADWFGIIKMSPVDKLRAEIKDIQSQIANADDLKKSPLLNPLGFMSNNIDAKKAELVKKLQGLQADLAKAQANAPLPKAATKAVAKPALHVAQTDAEKTLAARRAALLAQTGVDAATASAALLVAQDQTNVQLLRGSAEYYAAVKKQIDDEYQTKVITAEAEAAKEKAKLAERGKDWKGYADGVANINKALADKIGAAAEEQKQKQDAAGPSGFVRESLINGDKQIQQYADETAALGLVAGATAKLSYIQGELNAAKEAGIPLGEKELAQIYAKGDAIGRAAQAGHDAAEASADNIQVTDSLRSGLEDIGVASLHGFGSMKDAAKSALEQIAELILRLLVLKPLVESMSFLGPSGTAGGLGGLLGSIFGGGSLAANTTAAIAANPLLFANGGVMTPDGPRRLKRFASGGTSRQAAIFGEAGPEAAVPLPDGKRIPVDLRMPKMPNAMAPKSVVQQFSFDLRGAVMTQDILDQMNKIGRQAAQQGAVSGATLAKRQFVGNLRLAQRDVL